MPQCPYCKKKIDHLANIVTRYEYDLVPNEKGEALFQLKADQNPPIDEFRCPKCKAILADNLTKAKTILSS